MSKLGSAGSASQTRPDPWIGRVLEGKYELVRLMGEGGMGAVYEGVHVRLRRKVAVKLLHGALARSEKARVRFEGEARAAAALAHPSIVEVVDFGELDDGTYFLVMELLEGRDLEAEIRKGPLSVSRAVRIALQVCSALEAVHAKGIVHRDLKPANIFLTRERDEPDRVKVLDFGVAKFTQPDDGVETAHTATGQTIGTPIYMSPEQARGLRDVDHRTDIYALGAILFEALTGSVLFQFNNTPDLLLQICHGRVPRLRERRPDLPQGLDDVLRRMLERAPDDRYATAGEVAEALAPFASYDVGDEDTLAARRSDVLARLEPAAPPRAIEEPVSREPSVEPGVADTQPSSPPRPAARPLMWAVAAVIVLALGVGAWALTLAPEASGEPEGSSEPASEPAPAAPPPPPAAEEALAEAEPQAETPPSATSAPAAAEEPSDAPSRTPRRPRRVAEPAAVAAPPAPEPAPAPPAPSPSLRRPSSRAGATSSAWRCDRRAGDQLRRSRP
ncbi:MAG: protein kinase [Sandaracinaceae bacterium]|nr:protein kinase [Sandaracinaceae bacterium]